MSAAAAPHYALSHADYLKLEEQAETRHEYLAGEMFAMAVGSERHAAISANMLVSLATAARNKPCRVYGADMRLHIAERDHFCYPDVMLLCTAGVRHEQFVERPSLIIEVLSPSTAAYDRGLKFEHYRSIPSLLYYLLLEQDRPHAELFTRLPEEGWKLTEATGLAASLALPLAELYRQVEWPKAVATPL